MLSLSSCLVTDEEEVKDVYLDIPNEYAHVLSSLRSLNDSVPLMISSNHGLIDQLIFNKYSTEKNYSFIKSLAEIGEEPQSLYAENIDLTISPTIYKFYSFNYNINYLSRSLEKNYNRSDFVLDVFLINRKILTIELIDSNAKSNYILTDLGNTTLDSLHFSHLYKIEMPYDAVLNSEVKFIYFDIQKGVVRFDTFSNDSFNIKL